MTETNLHPTPRWREVVFEELRVIGLTLRPATIIAVVVLGIVTLVIGTDLVGGGPGFDPYERFPTALISFLFPFAVWRNEKPFVAAFYWTLPVDRRRLALTRVFAGWIWLMVALAALGSWLLALGLVAHASVAQTVLRVPLITTISAYLLGSALVLGLRYPIRWLLGTAGGFLVLVQITELLGRTESGEWRIVAGAGLSRRAVYGPHGLRALLRPFFAAVEHAGAVYVTLPGPAQWVVTAFFGFGIGLAALWAAAWRHRELRRQ